MSASTDARRVAYMMRELSANRSQGDQGRVISPRSFRLISIVIAAALFLQMTAVLLRTGPYGYPFINYPMYAAAHFEGERILVEHRIYARFTDGTERAISREDVGGHYWIYENWAKRMVAYPGDTYTLGVVKLVEPRDASGIRRWLKKIIAREQSAAQYITVYTNEVETLTGKTVESFRIEDYPAILTRDGFKSVEGVELLKILKIERGKPTKAGG